MKIGNIPALPSTPETVFRNLEKVEPKISRNCGEVGEKEKEKSRRFRFKKFLDKDSIEERRDSSRETVQSYLLRPSKGLLWGFSLLLRPTSCKDASLLARGASARTVSAPVPVLHSETAEQSVRKTQ